MVSGPVFRTCAALVCAGVLQATHAQTPATYPLRPIRIVVPFAPGAGTDLSIRTIAPKWAELLGQPMIIDNRVGASGIVGASIVAKAAADGYTLLFSATDLAINPALFASIPYDALKDFAPVGRAVNFPNFLVVNTELPAKNVQEFIALAKARTRSLSYGSAGNGTPPHISAELFKQLAGVELTHVPYKGSAQALTDVIAGQIQLMFVNTVSATPHVRAGRLRALGITTVQRVPFAPDVPTIAESGVPGYELVTWTGVAAPAGTAQAIITRLNRDLVRTLEMPDMKDRLLGQGSEVSPGTPAQFGQLMAADTVRLGRVARVAKMRLD